MTQRRRIMGEAIRDVIFDMDGTLLDTEKLYLRFWVEAANRMGAYVDEHGVDPKPGMLDTLRALRERGLRIGLATATPEPRARKYLRMVEAEAYFDAVTCADMAARGKPAPDIYLLACARTGVIPAQTLAVEDAPSGVLSAHAAGLRTVLIPDRDMPSEAITALCHAVLPDLRAVLSLIDP